MTELVRGWFGTFPLSTLVVNVVGCLLFGLCHGIGERWSPIIQAAVLTGFLGAFTTFSTFAFDCRVLIEQSRWFALLCNLVAQNALGLAAIWAGAALAAALRGAA